MKIRDLLKETRDIRWKSNINSTWNSDQDIINDIKLLLLTDFDNTGMDGVNETIKSIMTAIKLAKKEIS